MHITIDLNFKLVFKIAIGIFFVKKFNRSYDAVKVYQISKTSNEMIIWKYQIRSILI
jgi:hypothetical protein